MIEIVPSVPEDIPMLLKDLRDEDREELRLCGQDPEDDLEIAFGEPGVKFTALKDGEVLAMFGTRLLEDTPTCGLVWLLLTNKAMTHQKALVKECRAMLPVLIGDLDLIYNWIYIENTKVIKWLKHLGATFTGDKYPLLQGAEFESFYFLRN